MAEFLTERQKQILDFVFDFVSARGMAPTHLEIRRRFGYRSYGTVHKHLKLLRQKGYLRGGWNQKRGLELTEKTLRSRRAAANTVPFHGRIAAGRPIEAVAGVDDLSVPGHLLERGAPSRHYVLQVEGDSMIDDGICDGDLVVIAQRDDARSGEMIVALIDDEATLKRYYPEEDAVRLQPANREMEPLFVPADKLRVQGVVVGLMRRY